MGIIHYSFRHMIRRNRLRPDTESMHRAELMFQANLGEKVFSRRPSVSVLMVKGTDLRVGCELFMVGRPSTK